MWPKIPLNLWSKNWHGQNIRPLNFLNGGLHVSLLAVSARRNSDEKEPCIKGMPLHLCTLPRSISSCLLHYAPFFSLSLTQFFFSVFQTLLYFEQDVFFLQLGRGWTAPRLIKVAWLDEPTWTHTLVFDMDETHSDSVCIDLNHMLYAHFLCSNKCMTAVTTIPSHYYGNHSLV